MPERFSKEYFMRQSVVMMDFLSHLMLYKLDRLLLQSGITFKQSKILVYLFHNKDRETKQADLETFFHLKPSTISSMLTTLEKSGYIVRKKSDSDSRVNVLRATSDGENVLIGLIAQMKSVEDEVLSGLTAAEADKLRELLIKICETHPKPAKK